MKVKVDMSEDFKAIELVCDGDGVNGILGASARGMVRIIDGKPKIVEDVERSFSTHWDCYNLSVEIRDAETERTLAYRVCHSQKCFEAIIARAYQFIGLSGLTDAEKIDKLTILFGSYGYDL